MSIPSSVCVQVGDKTSNVVLLIVIGQTILRTRNYLGLTKHVFDSSFIDLPDSVTALAQMWQVYISYFHFATELAENEIL